MNPDSANSVSGRPDATGVGAWEAAVGWTFGGYLGLLQGAVILSGLSDWPSRAPILLFSFLLHGVLICLLGLAWGLVCLRLGNIAGRRPSRATASASFLSFLIFVVAAIYIHVTRLPGIDVLAPISIALTVALGLICLALIPLWSRFLGPWLFAFESRGGWRSRRWWWMEGIRSLAVILASVGFPLLAGPPPDAGTPTAGTAPRPNVVVFVMDTTRSDHLSCYGYARPTTPFLETLAARGTLFEEAVSPSPWTLPSHASILTGLYPGSHGSHWQHWLLDDSNTTLAEILADYGYATGAFVSNPFLSRTFNLDQGFDVYDDELEPWILRTYLWRIAVKSRVATWVGPRYSERRAENTAAAVLRWIRNVGDHPYFLFVNFNDPHAPYDPRGEFRTRFSGNPGYSGPLLASSAHDDFILLEEADLSSEDMDYVTDLYDGEILYLDGVMGQLLRTLAERSGDREMLVVVMGDHGECFGEHGFLGHRGSLYEPTLRVPLIVSWPGRIPEGTRVLDRVQNLDVAPTVLDLLGLEVPAGMEGRTLASHWEDPAADEAGTPAAVRGCFAELYPEPDLVKRHPWMGRRLSAIYQGPWKLIRGDDGSAELFHLATDPGEGIDRTSSEPETLDDLVAILSAWQTTLDTGASPVPLDARTADRLRSLGYLQ